MAKSGKIMSKFVWDEVKLKAATELANGNQRDDDILPKLGVSKRTLSRWKEHPDFQLKISEIIADIDISQKAERIKIAKKEIKRVLARLDMNEDKPGSRDLVALLKYIAEEKEEIVEHKQIKIMWDDSDDAGTDNQNTVSST